MNQYGVLAREHWTRWLPHRVEQLEDPNSFFSALGQEVAAEIDALAVDLAGDDPPGEDYLGKVGRLRMARSQAEERVLAQRVLLTPEPDAEGLNDEPEQPASTAPAARWVPVVEDPTDPWWQQAAREETGR